MRSILFTVLLALPANGICKRINTSREVLSKPLPNCRFIYVGGCKYIWCYYDRSGSLESADPACRPVNARVWDRPWGPLNP